MATRQEFNACMGPFIRGKEKTKEERQAGFCIGAKICSGKAKTEEEAKAICARPHLPKWAQGGAEMTEGEKTEKTEKPEELTCPQKTQRALETIQVVRDLIKSGQTDKIKEPLKQVLQDIHSCAPEEIKALASDTLSEVRKTAGEFYFKGEGREMVKSLDTLRDLMGHKPEKPELNASDDKVVMPTEDPKTVQRAEESIRGGKE